MNQFTKKRFVLTGILFFSCLMYGYSQTSKNEQPDPPVVRGFMMSGSFTAADCKDAKAWGANVIRMQLSPVSFASRSGKSLWEAWPAYLDRIETQMRYAIDAGLKVVIDLHQPPFENVKSFDHAEFWERSDLEEGFCRLWTDIVKRLLPYKSHIWGYDLLNEPLDRAQLPGVTRQWKPLAEKIIRKIRETDKDTWIIYEPGPGSLFTGFRGLEPLSDPRIIYSGHFYEPQDFTHQGVFNIAGTDLDEAKTKTGIPYPGTVKNSYWDKARLEQLLRAADEFQKRWNVPIYVGEFSVIRWAPQESANQWLRDALSLFEARGWSWTYHAFREFHGWSLEHDETFWMQGSPRPERVTTDTERAKIIKKGLEKNNLSEQTENHSNPVYKGHDLPRLRGAMISPNRFKQEDLDVIAGKWKANHVRWQIIWNGFPNGPADRASIEEFDAWIDKQCEQLDRMLPELERYGVRVTLDLHTPPGGRMPQAEGSAMRMFSDTKLQDAFVATWQKLARKYKDVKTIWCYDILNEAVEGKIPENKGILTWRELALKTSKEIRKIDPVKAIVIEPAPWGGPDALEQFEPFDPKEVPNVVYSVHMYVPHSFTHQGVYDQNVNLVYPGRINGRNWDKEQLRNALRIPREYAKKHGVAIYIGEFGSIRWAPDNSTYQYLKDCIEIFEEEGWDWAYHAFREWQGWSVEHGQDKNDDRPTAEPTDRELLLRSWFEKNER